MTFITGDKESRHQHRFVLFSNFINNYGVIYNNDNILVI